MDQPDKFTPIQQAMLEILSDGLPHTREELHECCKPSSLPALSVHMVRLRKRLIPKGESVVCVIKNRRICYQHVRLLVSPYAADQ